MADDWRIQSDEERELLGGVIVHLPNPGQLVKWELESKGGQGILDFRVCTQADVLLEIEVKCSLFHIHDEARRIIQGFQRMDDGLAQPDADIEP